jgi:hypothetical protein
VSKIDWQRDRQRRLHAQAARDEYAKIPLRTPEAPEHRIWLLVPYRDKEEAKAVGCRWDPKHKRWYAPLATPQDKLKRWL